MRFALGVVLWVLLGFHVEPLEMLSRGSFQKAQARPSEKSKPKPEFLVYAFKEYALEVTFPANWKVTNAGKQGFMVEPRNIGRNSYTNPSTLPYVDVYRSSDPCIETNGFKSETIPPGKEIVFHEMITCRPNKVFVILTYWEADPEKEKTKAVLLSILKSMKASN